MRTKHIFYSMALVAALGACTQEEFNTPVETNEQNLAVRPLLGDIQITTDPQTRFALGEGNAAQPVFADGDKLGAAIMDEPVYNLTSPNTYEELLKTAANGAVDLYNIVEYYSSNNCFTLNNGIWTVDQPMVEGNYLFYAPYSAKMQARTPLSIALPVKQDASESKAALDEFYKSGSVVRVGYQFLEAKNGEPQKPNVNMMDVFAYPLFTIQNNFSGYLVDENYQNAELYTGPITLDSLQVSVVNASNVIQEMVCGGVLKHADATKTGLSATEGVVGMMKKAGKWMNSPMENYTKDLLSATTTGCAGNAGSKTDVAKTDRKDGIITTFDFGGKALATKGSYQFYGVLPAAVYTSEDGAKQMRLTLYVTIQGKQYKVEQADVTVNAQSGDVTVGQGKSGVLLTSDVDKITLIKGQKYPQEELNFDKEEGLSPKASAGNILTVNLMGGVTSASVTAQVATLVPEKAPVTLIENNEDFIGFFKDQLNGSALAEQSAGGINGPKYQFSEKTEALINSELIDALFTYNNKGSLTIDRGLVIANNVKVKTIGTANSVNSNYTPVTFVSANKNEYTINLKTNSADYDVTTTTNVLVSMHDSKNLSVHVLSAGNYTLSAATEVGNLRNEGTVATGTNNLTVDEFVNNGELQVKASVIGEIENNGKITVANDASNAGFTVSAGAGVIMINSGLSDVEQVLEAISVNPEQTVVYETSATVDADAIKKADAFAKINAISGNAVTLNQGALDQLKDIKTIMTSGGIISQVNGTLDLTDLTLQVTATAAWNGSGNTVVNNATIVLNSSVTLTLNNIRVNGTVIAGNGAKISADGEDGFWNGKKN